MRLEYNLELKQTQKLLMTPQLRQAIKLLQLPVLELTAYLDDQYMENPLLEIEDTEEDNGEQEQQVDEQLFDLDWEQYFQDRDTGEPLAADKQNKFELVTGNEYTLQQRLHQQLSLVNLDPETARIARYIVNNLDDSGYLNICCEEVAAILQVEPAAVDAALAVVQGLEPAGIGARDLQECLLLQLKSRDDIPPCTREIINDYLPVVAKGKIPLLAEALDVTPAVIQKAVDFIKTLDPKPGQSVTSERDAGHIVPDITVLDVGGKWMVMVNDSYTPRLRINPFYQRLLKAADSDETKRFLRDKLNSALWLLKAVEQRRSTLHKITEFIIEYQQDFFEKGVKFLRPLRLRDVAEAVEVHESTVSRAINGKYVQTPRGLYELKYFFSVNLETSDGGGTSSTGAKKELQDLVEQEDPTRPLTDQQLSEKLKERGIRISRRTVAKYREELGIASSTLRKRWD